MSTTLVIISSQYSKSPSRGCSLSTCWCKWPPGAPHTLCHMGNKFHCINLSLSPLHEATLLLPTVGNLPTTMLPGVWRYVALLHVEATVAEEQATSLYLGNSCLQHATAQHTIIHCCGQQLPATMLPRVWEPLVTVKLTHCYIVPPRGPCQSGREQSPSGSQKFG